jgi:hypothetical protein
MPDEPVSSLASTGNMLNERKKNRSPQKNGERRNQINFSELGTALRVAKDVAIDKTAVCAGISPEGKKDLIARMQVDGELVVMVGDGINDSPALAADAGDCPVDLHGRGSRRYCPHA